MPARVSSCILLLTLSMLLLALTSVADLGGIDAQSTMMVSEPEKRGMRLAGTPHTPIAIDGDANFSDTALLEGWAGDGSPENPFIIDGLDIDLQGAVVHCISISNTRVSFTISNCNLTGASVFPGAGIYLENVTSSELVNNTCSNNHNGIELVESNHNTVVNNTFTSNDNGIYLDGSRFNSLSDNTCTSNDNGISLQRLGSNIVVNNACNNNTWSGIVLSSSDSNTVANNTCTNNDNGINLQGLGSNIVVNNACNNNTWSGIVLSSSVSNTVVNNTCTSNDNGIYLEGSHFNIVANNTCTSNGNRGIALWYSDFNTVANNICNNNWIGIYLHLSNSNTVTHNTCLSNTEHDIYLDHSISNTVENNITTGFYSRLLLLGVALLLLPLGIVVLGLRKRMVFPKGDKDDLVVPTRYRLVSWLRKRRSLKHVDVDESLEPDSSDQ